MRPRHIFASLAVFTSLLLPAMQSHAAEEVNLYSARIEALIKPVLDRFTEQTGIRVNLVTGNADELISRLQNEGRNSPADVLITTDAGRLHRAKTVDVLQPINSEIINSHIPESYRDPEGYWFGLSLRARPILYVKDKVDPAELSTYEDLANPKWKNQICVRSSSHIYNQSLTASLIAADGVEATETWAKGVVGNFAKPPRGGDRDQIKAAAAGQCNLVIANTYYLAGMHLSNDASDREAAEKLAVFWPNQTDRGAHVNVSGAGVTKSAKNKNNAIKLIEFLSDAEAQAWYGEANGEYPVSPTAPVSDILAAWGEFKADDINLSRLGELNPEASKLLDRAGWE